MASVEECEQALAGLAAKLAEVDPATRRKHTVNRTLSCRITDLDVAFTGRLGAEGLCDLRRSDAPQTGAEHDGRDELRPEDAQIRMAATSDDLVALTGGELGVAGAWASGRLKIDASLMDVLRLRTLL